MAAVILLVPRALLHVLSSGHCASASISADAPAAPHVVHELPELLSWQRECSDCPKDV